MKIMRKALGQTALAAVLGVGATAANADLITDWDFTVTGEWLVGSSVFVPGPVNPKPAGTGLTFESSELLSWGADLGADVAPVDSGDRFTSRSGLEVDNTSVMGSVATNGGTVDTILVRHYNNTIAGQYDTLDTALFLTTLTLTPTAPMAGDPFGPVAQNIPIQFRETFNNADGCGFPSDTICDDIFVFQPETLEFSFHIDDFVYTTIIGAPGLGLLPAATCTAAGLDGVPCVGLTTDEGAISEVQFNFQITGRPKSVPVPATLGLLGLGLIGFAVRKRASRA